FWPFTTRWHIARCSEYCNAQSPQSPADFEYFQTPSEKPAKHEWIKSDGKSGTVGISEYAEQKLGDIVYVELPNQGDIIKAKEQCGVIESVKAVSEIYSPASGTVTELNSTLESNSGIINKSPLDKGWLFKMTLSDPSELEHLMTEEKYKAFLESES
ncbi:glycine cleavage system H protein, partial [Opisthorchis viverrini]